MRLALELPGNIVMKTAVHAIESSPWASWEHWYENCSACHGVFPLSFLGTLLWKLQCMSWSLSLWTSWEHWYENCSACHGVLHFEPPGNIVMKSEVHAMESFPWASWERCYENCSACHGVFPLSFLGTLYENCSACHQVFLWAFWEHYYENCSACHGVFLLNFPWNIVIKTAVHVMEPFELPGNIVMKTAVHVMESFPWASWAHCYENCSAWHGVFPLNFLGTLLWKLQCMSLSLSLELPGNIVMKTAVHDMESFPWTSWEHCYENCSASHWLFPLSFLGTLLWKLQCMTWSLTLELPWNIVMKTLVHVIESFSLSFLGTEVHVMESFTWSSWEHCYENCSACHGVFPLSFWEHCYENCSACHGIFPLSFLGTLLWKLQCMTWILLFELSENIVMKTSVHVGNLSFEFPGNIVMKAAVHAMESFLWTFWEHCYENWSACHGVLSFLGTLLWKLRCMSWNLSLELPGNIMKTAVHVMESFPWASGNIVMKTAVYVMESFLWASWEQCYENCCACHGVFPLSFLGTLLWKLQCMPWSLSLELSGNIVMKTAVHVLESLPWASWEHCYENCSAFHRVFSMIFLGTLFWKQQCMPCREWRISLWLFGNVVMKSAVHAMESLPWAFWEHCYENCSACHGVFPMSFLGTLLWKLQCMPWSLSLELPGNAVMKTAVHAMQGMEYFPLASWERCYEICSACHGVFPMSFLGTVLWKLQCMSWSLSLEFSGSIVMKTAVHVMESFPLNLLGTLSWKLQCMPWSLSLWTSWEHCYENCSACHEVFSLSFMERLLWKL